MADLLTAMRDYLVAQGLARDPRVDGAAPPLWLDPREGVPAPGEGAKATEQGADLVLGAYFTGGIAARPFESSLREDTIDIWLRAAKSPTAIATAAQLRAALIDRRDWDMAGLRVIDSEEWRPLQRLSSDEQGFTFVWSVIFQTYAA